ncbi:hypothetical protein Tco_1260797 [Tanacetum coccineum]
MMKSFSKDLYRILRILQKRKLEDIYEARLQDEARVADIINNGQWMWPDGWMNRYPILATLNRNIDPTDSEDKVT